MWTHTCIRSINLFIGHSCNFWVEDCCRSIELFAYCCRLALCLCRLGIGFLVYRFVWEWVLWVWCARILFCFLYVALLESHCRCSYNLLFFALFSILLLLRFVVLIFRRSKGEATFSITEFFALKNFLINNIVLSQWTDSLSCTVLESNRLDQISLCLINSVHAHLCQRR